MLLELTVYYFSEELDLDDLLAKDLLDVNFNSWYRLQHSNRSLARGI